MSKLLLGAALFSLASYCMAAPAKTMSHPTDTHQTDAEFLKMAAQADMTTAHLGQMAGTRAANSKVKDFAYTLAQDHTKDYDEVTTLAAKVGDTVPKAIDKQNDTIIATLNRSNGKSFDHAFLARESLQHEKLVKAFKWEAEHSSSADIRAYASKTLPTIERHLHDTQDLLKEKS